MAKTKRPRIHPDDYRQPSELKPGEWIRTPFYTKSHMVGAALDTARCGYPLVIDLEWYEGYREALHQLYDADPGEFYLAIDRRKESNHCKDCPKKDWSVEPEQVRMEFREPEPLEEGQLTPAQRLQRRRLTQAAQRVAQELEATVL